MPMTAKNIDRAPSRTHTHLLARRKSFRKIFCSKCFRDYVLEKLTFVKNSSHPRLSATAKRWKGALLMIHSARTDLDCSFACVSLAFACAMPLLGHRTFSFFPCPCGLSFLRVQVRALCLLHRHWMSRSARQQPALSALNLANLFMSLKTNL